jgi:hypothetical protein
MACLASYDFSFVIFEIGKDYYLASVKSILFNVELPLKGKVYADTESNISTASVDRITNMIATQDFSKPVAITVPLIPIDPNKEATIALNVGAKGETLLLHRLQFQKHFIGNWCESTTAREKI